MALERKIVLKEGLGDLKFGLDIDQVMSLLGNPTEAETIGEDLEIPTTVLHYQELGLSLFFDYPVTYNSNLGMPWENTSQFSQASDKEVLICMDLSTLNVELFGEKIIDYSSQQIVKLMVANNIVSQTMDEEAWGEKRISFEDYAIDFFFFEDKLTSINFGK